VGLRPATGHRRVLAGGRGGEARGGAETDLVGGRGQEVPHPVVVPGLSVDEDRADRAGGRELDPQEPVGGVVGGDHGGGAVGDGHRLGGGGLVARDVGEPEGVGAGGELHPVEPPLVHGDGRGGARGD